MQVFGLPGHLIRTGRAASRLIDAKTPDIAAAVRRDLVARWRGAMAKGLSAEDAAKAVAVPRSTLYRWERRPILRSRRPHSPRRPQWPTQIIQAVEDLRADNPMWGKRKLAWFLRRDGLTVSISTVGRILNPVTCCPGSNRYETRALRKVRGSPKLKLSRQHLQENPRCRFLACLATLSAMAGPRRV